MGSGGDISVVMPTTPNKYTILEEVELPVLTADGATFLGWFKEPSCENKVEKIEKGSYGNLVFYAGWRPE